MIISETELLSLIEARNGMPHSLLGVHALGDDKGLVGRALIPGAVSVQIVAIDKRNGTRFELERIEDTPLFEATSTESLEVFPYELEVTYDNGDTVHQRDPYSFLPTLSEEDLYLYGEGRELRIFDKLGAHLKTMDGVAGVSFAVWAPNAKGVSVIGEFNHWDGRPHQMRILGNSGIWELFIPGIDKGALYKFEIKNIHGETTVKTDPYGTFFEIAPKQAAIVWNTDSHDWKDAEWMEKRQKTDWLRSPMSTYEIHMGSWKKKTEAESYSYRELAGPLIAYLHETGFTHVEFMPVAEHAFYPSWGYQVTGFYAPSSRYGTPDDFQYLVDQLHQADIGVIIDWVPAHFPRDEWALANFDGTALYEHGDPRQGAHQDWGTLIFNYSRHEVKNFMLANALFWLERYHIDGLRVDAVASMLYLDYSRKDGEWIPNKYGGRENIENVEFLKEFNHTVHTEFPGVVTIAEESTAWPQVSRPPKMGGLGFTMKWNMGWMHDTLNYFKHESIHRKYHQSDLTFAMLYHYHENFILPLSHDEVVHGKGSLIRRMPGDESQQFANLRSLLCFQWTFPGKKLLFMGSEFGQFEEWNEDGQLSWDALEQGPFHKGVQKLVTDLNHLYRNSEALYQADFDGEGFDWIDNTDHGNSVLIYVRRNQGSGKQLIKVLNLTPVPREGYRIGLPTAGLWKEVINTDAKIYGGSDFGNPDGVQTVDAPLHGQPHSGSFSLPPLSAVIFEC
ncbi:1,4-alpha-glucan branching protein GlgB [bacterium]|nr:1,4-alpha-glucan branching protein GlgB [bacterium]